MDDTRFLAPDWLIRWEPLIVFVGCVLALCSVPVALGHTGLSWDALNHHIYLGWTADHPRFDRDYLAASYQSYQFPYLYWPVYMLAMLGASGVVAGIVLTLLHLTVAPALWKLAHACIPGREWFEVGMRALAVALAFMGGVVLSMLDSTSNDLLAAIPLVWAIALMIEALASPAQTGFRRAVVLSGLLAGVSVGFKLSNVPIAILLPLLWAWRGASPSGRLLNVLLGGLAATVALAVTYGYWGWLLWTNYGNPFYPFFDPWLEPLRLATGWKR
ncbi:hypothetical protein ACFPOE_04035 [Caenimonas terrae]|uniref:DUF2029 domain-containing protein n=1 Tax=Caenimonas terrae TaxID=696074 RepID=A0ABW0N7S6_9BURK